MLGFILWFSLSFGMQEQLSLSYPYFTEISIHAENEYIDIYGIYKNEMVNNFPYFTPMQDTFTVGTKFTYNNISLSLEHQCSHALNVGGRNEIYDTGYNKLFITISSR
jgi:hypothetical protein